jgi:hypothetical protein
VRRIKGLITPAALKEVGQDMTEKMSEHPILAYITFVLPAILLCMGVVFGANVFLLIVTAAWLGVAFMVIFLPMSSDNGSSI